MNQDLMHWRFKCRCDVALVGIFVAQVSAFSVICLLLFRIVIRVPEFGISDFSRILDGSLLLVSQGVQLLCFYEAKVRFAIGASENECLKIFIWIPGLDSQWVMGYWASS